MLLAALMYSGPPPKMPVKPVVCADAVAPSAITKKKRHDSAPQPTAVKRVQSEDMGSRVRVKTDPFNGFQLDQSRWPATWSCPNLKSRVRIPLASNHFFCGQDRE